MIVVTVSIRGRREPAIRHIERWALRLQVSKVARWAVAVQAAADEGTATAAHAVTVAQAKKTWAPGVYPLHDPLLRVTAKGLLTSRMGSSWVTEARRLAVEAAEDAAKVGSM